MNEHTDMYFTDATFSITAYHAAYMAHVQTVIDVPFSPALLHRGMPNNGQPGNEGNEVLQLVEWVSGLWQNFNP